jgi:hypothetical protein
MASISTDSGGNRRIQFLGADRKRYSVRLGKVSDKIASDVARRVEDLADAKATGGSPAKGTLQWLAEVSDQLHDKLARVGLTEARSAGPVVSLGPFIDTYIAGRTDAKPRTILNLTSFRRRLVKFFGPDRALPSIKRSDADAWVLYLKANHSPGTAGRTIKGARQFFQAAVRADIITRNPFEGIKASTAVEKDRQYFVSAGDAEKVLAACPDGQWRLVVALCRYGGLRCPS